MAVKNSLIDGILVETFISMENGYRGFNFNSWQRAKKVEFKLGGIIVGKIINLNGIDTIQDLQEKTILKKTEDFLTDVRSSCNIKKTFSVPIVELSTFGAGIASIIPEMNTITQTTTVASDGLYRLANAAPGDVLKSAKNGNWWGAFKTSEGTSKFAQLQSAGPITATTQTVAAFNPATIMMSVALFSIEQKIGKIEEIQEQILSFLEKEKESEVEADVQNLMSIVRKYVYNWDREKYVGTALSQVLGIQGTARKNMIGYQKKIEEILDKKQFIVVKNNMRQSFANLEKNFQYYRLSLYTFSLASFMEVMLNGNFKEGYILDMKNEIEKFTSEYRDLFKKGSIYLENIGKSVLETNVMKGVGFTGKTVGKFIGSIPIIKEGPVDEFLQDVGTHLKKNAAATEKEAVYSFASMSNPETALFIDKMEDIIQIYNYTEQICFDDKNIYLLTNRTAV